MVRFVVLLLALAAGCASAAELDRVAKTAAVGARQVGCSREVGELLMRDGGVSDAP